VGREPSSDLRRARRDPTRVGLVPRCRRAWKDKPVGRTIVCVATLRQPAGCARTRAEDGTVWPEHLGEFYDAQAVRAVLSGAGAGLDDPALLEGDHLLVLTTGSGQRVYPAFQFDSQGPVAGLGAVLAALPEAVVSRWTLASWLINPDAELADRRPIDVLRENTLDGQASTMVAARHWAAALASR